MPAVPLAINAYKRASAFQPEVICRNVLVEEDKSGASPDNLMRLDRPGLTAWRTLGASLRGLFTQAGLFGGKTYAAAGTALYTVTSGAATSIGTIGSTGRVAWAANYEKVAILAGTTVYLYNGTTVAAVTMPDSRAVQHIDVLNNYFILACVDGRFYWIVPGASTVDPLNFATAESSPDGLEFVRRLGDELVFGGQTNNEVWQSTGDAAAPFLRAGGRNQDRGCLEGARDAAQRFDNSLFWVGNDGVVYRYGQVPQRISDHGIEQRIRERTGNLSACIVEVDGKKGYVLKIPGQGSFGFDPETQQWTEFATYGVTEWKPHVSASNASGWLVGDETSGAIWVYDPTATTDAGTLIERIVTGTVPLQSRPPRNDSISIGAGGSADFTLQIRWRDGQEAFPSVYEEIEVRAPADICPIYRLGQPDQPFRTFEVRITAAVKARISGLMANEAWQ